MVERYEMSETEWQDQVVHLASLRGWNTMHVRRSRVREDRWATATSHDGWPDLVLWHPGRHRRLIVAEIKTNRGRCTAEQLDTLRSIHACGTLAYIWRPRDFDEVRRILEGDIQDQLTVVELHPEPR